MAAPVRRAARASCPRDASTPRPEESLVDPRIVLMPSLRADGKRVAKVLAGVLERVAEEPREPLVAVNGEQLAGVVKPACGV